MPLEDSYIGVGWSFPPSFTPPSAPPASNATYQGGAAMVTGLTDIEQSLQILFTTRLGERVLAPDYGSELSDMVFEELDASLMARLQFQVQTAVLYHEPRIELLDTEVTEATEQAGLLLLTLTYRVRSTNSRHNYVYPFYLQEGSELRDTVA
jgi:phage baseplate assembly protein W